MATKAATNEQDPDAGDGGISTEYTFWCRLCSAWIQLPSQGSQRRTIDEAKRYGWRHAKPLGWICRKHK